MEIAKQFIKEKNSRKGYIKLEGELFTYLNTEEELKIEKVDRTKLPLVDYQIKSLNYPFLETEISKIIHDFKNLLNPLCGLLQNDTFACNEDLNEISQYYRQDFMKVIDDYEKIRQKFYSQRVNLLMLLDLYLNDFVILDRMGNFTVTLTTDLEKISRRLNNLHLYDGNFLVLVDILSETDFEIDKERLEEIV